jgi:hypothetical protein
MVSWVCAVADFVVEPVAVIPIRGTLMRLGVVPSHVIAM